MFSQAGESVAPCLGNKKIQGYPTMDSRVTRRLCSTEEASLLRTKTFDKWQIERFKNAPIILSDYWDGERNDISPVYWHLFWRRYGSNWAPRRCHRTKVQKGFVNTGVLFKELRSLSFLRLFPSKQLIRFDVTRVTDVTLSDRLTAFSEILTCSSITQFASALKSFFSKGAKYLKILTTGFLSWRSKRSTMIDALCLS